jgi:hypothetical protein
MDLSNPQLHYYISDYTDGTMSEDLVPIFEQFLRMHPEIAHFVEKARKGHSVLIRYRNRLIGQ